MTPPPAAAAKLLHGAVREPGLGPRRWRRRAAARGLLAVLIALGILGCGKKGPPVAPERRLPAAAAGLQASIEGTAIIVSWTNPSQRLDGTPLRDLVAVKLHRREEPQSASPRPAILSQGRVVGYDEIAAIRLDAPAPAEVRGQAVRWVDLRGLTFGRRYVYVVTALDASGRSSPPSERLSVAFVAAPGPPRNLAAEPEDGRVHLRWDPPAGFIDGTSLAGDIRYLILRGTDAEGPLAAITPEPLAATSFTDTGLENDTTYRYAVRAVRVAPGGVPATGEESAAVSATPVDTTPPGPPTDLVVIPSASAVRLAWNPSPDADVARYAVYRATAAGDFVRIGSTPAVNTVFVDLDVTPGATYRYVVTALDRARTPNESKRSNEVRVTIP